MPQKVRWGILGPGRISRKFAADLRLVENAELVAVGSRTKESALAFAREFPVAHIHDSYEALAANPEVDVIYISTPHNLHKENTVMCLNAGKPVLCEKPFAMNLHEVQQMVDVARDRKVFLMEALWTKFMPHYRTTVDLVKSGKLGTIKSMLVNFGFAPAPPVPARLFDPALGGGTILDIGIYNVFITISMMGIPDVVEASITPTAEGVDEQCAVLFKYKNGALAQLFSTFSSNLATEADINGNKGRIRLTTRFYEPSATIEYYPERVDSKQIIPVEKESGFGYQYEARHVGECLQKGLIESPLMSFKESIELISLLDKIRNVAGVKYAADRK
ncbi:MAG: hypothetical protein C5B52_13525 [Bacteroidetes bacterium]|nr:MAG: hypothetical protein C5B52_13525 [Bacteroidota bacterium]